MNFELNETLGYRIILDKNFRKQSFEYYLIKLYRYVNVILENDIFTNIKKCKGMTFT